MKASPLTRIRDFLAGPAPSGSFKIRSLIETIVFLAVCLLVNYVFNPDDMGYLAVHPHPFWIVVMLIPIRYGFKEGIAASLLAGVCYLIFSIARESGYNLTYPLLFLLAAGVLGQNREVLDRKYNRAAERLESLAGRLDTSKQNEMAYQDTLNHFERTIAMQFTNATDMFRELSATRAMSSGQMKRYLLLTVKKFLQADKCAYFEVNAGKCIKKYDIACEGPLEEAYPMEEDLILLEVYRTGKFAYLHITDEESVARLDKSRCLLAGCLTDSEGEIRGLVGIESLPFSNYNSHSFKLFTSLLEVWSSAINDKIRLERIQAKSIFDETTGIYKYHYFSARIEQEFKRAQEFAIPLSLSLIQINDFNQVPEDKKLTSFLFLANTVKKFISELDLVAHYSDPATVAVIQPFHLAAGADKRIKSIITEIESYKLTPYEDGEKPFSFCHATGDFQVGMDSCGDFVTNIEKELQKQISP